MLSTWYCLWSAQIRLFFAVDILIQNIASGTAANFRRHNYPGLDAGGAVFSSWMDAGNANLDLILPMNGFIFFTSKTPGFPGLIPYNYTEDPGSYPTMGEKIESQSYLTDVSLLHLSSSIIMQVEWQCFN